MSYEQQIKLKHAIEDSFKELLSCASALTDRELEIAMARTADSIASDTGANATENSEIIGKVLRMVLHLRQAGEMHQNKPKRVWYSMRKSTLRRQVAEPHLNQYMDKHQKLCAEIDERNRKRRKAHDREVASKKQERESMPFLKRLFGGPKLPSPPSLEVRPFTPSRQGIESKIAGHLDTDELLIQIIVNHSFPHTKLASDFATEENLKTMDIRLLGQG